MYDTTVTIVGNALNTPEWRQLETNHVLVARSRSLRRRGGLTGNTDVGLMGRVCGFGSTAGGVWPRMSRRLC